MVIPQELLKPAGEAVYLSDVDQRLSAALDSQGYVGRTYYSVPDGFAIVTQLEQFLSDGRSEEPPDRWAPERGQLSIRDFSLEEYARALFTADPGYYRIIVFVTTPDSFSQEGTVERTEAMSWLEGGANKLPEAIGSHEYSEEYATTALIYEFEQPRRGEEAALKRPGLLTASVHLEGANIYDSLVR